MPTSASNPPPPFPTGKPSVPLSPKTSLPPSYELVLAWVDPDDDAFLARRHDDGNWHPEDRDPNDDDWPTDDNISFWALIPNPNPHD